MNKRIGHKEPKQSVLLLVAATEDGLLAHNRGSWLAGPDQSFLVDAAVCSELDELSSKFCHQMVAGYENIMIANDPMYPGVGSTEILTEESFGFSLDFNATQGWIQELLMIVTSLGERKTTICVLPPGTNLNLVTRSITVFFHGRIHRPVEPPTYKDGSILRLTFEPGDEPSKNGGMFFRGMQLMEPLH